MSYSNFLVESLGFSVSSVLSSADSGSFTSFFSICIPLISFSSLMKKKQDHLVYDLRGHAFKTLYLMKLLCTDLLYFQSSTCMQACWHVCMLSCVWLSATLWTAVWQAPLSMGFSRQGYWNGFPFPPPVDQACISCIGRQILYHWVVWLAQLPKAVITTCILYWEIFPPPLVTSCHYTISNRIFVFENLGWCDANWFFWTERTPVELFHPGRDTVRVFEFIGGRDDGRLLRITGTIILFSSYP